MAVQVPAATTSRHVTGDLVFRAYNFTQTMSDGDTAVVPQNRIEIAIVAPTTSVAVGVTVTTNSTPGIKSTLTFAGGPWSGRVGVWSRIG